MLLNDNIMCVCVCVCVSRYESTIREIKIDPNGITNVLVHFNGWEEVTETLSVDEMLFMFSIEMERMDRSGFESIGHQKHTFPWSIQRTSNITKQTIIFF